MMATTHAFVGLAMAAAVAVVAPDVALAAAVGGLAGGAVPDLDLIAAHRRTLHFPLLYWPPALLASGLALLAPGSLTVGTALFFLAAAIHSASDVLGGGLEPRPWEGRSEKAVYVHPVGRWLRPRQWVRYDGAPEDLALGAAAALPGLFVFEDPIRSVVLAALLISAIYTLVRKRLVEIVPDRYL